MRQIDTQHILAEVKAFPSMPDVAAKLVRLLNNTDSTAAQIEKVLRYEPGLTANVLKLTNSAYFGVPTKVGSVKQAIVLLGWKRLSQIVIPLCMGGIMGKPVPGYDLPPGGLWRHSIAVSVAAETLTRVLGVPLYDGIFTAALLHDVGKLVMGRFVRDDLPEIEECASRGISFEMAEFMITGIDHAELGAHILKGWSFPPDLVSAVRWHHNPDRAVDTSELIDIVHVADVLSMMIGIGTGREGLQHNVSEAVIRRMGLHPHHLEKAASLTLQSYKDLIEAIT